MVLKVVKEGFFEEMMFKPRSTYEREWVTGKSEHRAGWGSGMAKDPRQGDILQTEAISVALVYDKQKKKAMVRSIGFILGSMR